MILGLQVKAKCLYYEGVQVILTVVQISSSTVNGYIIQVHSLWPSLLSHARSFVMEVFLCFQQCMKHM